MKKLSVTRLVKLAVVAAVYVVLTLALGFMSYANIQFRIAEALMLLCFYMVFGTAATILAVLLIYISPNIYVASLAPVVTNAFVVGFELYYFLDLPFWLSCFQVAAGEFVCVCILGVVLFKLLEKNKKFMQLVTN